jgi:aminoglycoside 6'-N-acetyltransferase
VNAGHKITFRAALPSDLETLKHWDKQPHLLDSDPNDDWNWEIEWGKKLSTPAN